MPLIHQNRGIRIIAGMMYKHYCLGVSIFSGGVLHGLVVVKCLTRNLGVLDSSRSGSYGIFMGVSLGKTLQSSSIILVKLREDMNNVRWLKYCWKRRKTPFNQSVNSIFLGKKKQFGCSDTNDTKQIERIFSNLFSAVITITHYIQLYIHNATK